jgi:hypothetical protein
LGAAIGVLDIFLMAFLGSRGLNGCDNELRLGLCDTDQSLERSQAECIAEFVCAVHFRPGSEMYWLQADRSANRCL